LRNFNLLGIKACLDQLGLLDIFPCTLAQRILLPYIKSAGLDAQAPAHHPNFKLVAMLGNEHVSHFESLAKYAVTFEDIARLCHLGQFALQLPDLGVLAGNARHHLREPPLPGTQRVLADAEPLRNLRYRLTKLGDLGTTSRLNSSLKLGFPIVASCPQI
jgi:hypothetical protein